MHVVSLLCEYRNKSIAYFFLVSMRWFFAREGTQKGSHTSLFPSKGKFYVFKPRRDTCKNQRRLREQLAQPCCARDTNLLFDFNKPLSLAQLLSMRWFLQGKGHKKVRIFFAKPCFYFPKFYIVKPRRDTCKNQRRLLKIFDFISSLRSKG